MKGRSKVPQYLQQPVPKVLGETTEPQQNWEIAIPEMQGIVFVII